MRKVGRRGRVQCAIDNRAALGEEFAPVRQKLRIVVLARKVRFETRPDVNVHAVGVLTPGFGRLRISRLPLGERTEPRDGSK